jgi:hypothetical protein
MILVHLERRIGMVWLDLFHLPYVPLLPFELHHREDFLYEIFLLLQALIFRMVN